MLFSFFSNFSKNSFFSFRCSEYSLLVIFPSSFKKSNNFIVSIQKTFNSFCMKFSNFLPPISLLSPHTLFFLYILYISFLISFRFFLTGPFLCLSGPFWRLTVHKKGYTFRLSISFKKYYNVKFSIFSLNSLNPLLLIKATLSLFRNSI